MWSTRDEILNEKVIKYQIAKDDSLISYGQWIDHIQQDDHFIAFFTNVLKDNPFDGYFWEVKPMEQSELSNNFEFVLVKSFSIDKLIANEANFKEYFTSDDPVVSFSNLRGDAHLIVPAPIDSQTNYAHLAAFLRTGTQTQVMAFWKRVGQEYAQLIGEKKKWLSTAGMGVHWLHVRVDSRPKYYRYEGYR